MRLGVYGVDEHGDRGYVVPSEKRSHFRYGYQVGAAEPRYLGITNGDQRDKAVTAAQTAACEISDQLRKLGAPHDVSWWIQTVTTNTAVSYTQPEVEALT